MKSIITIGEIMLRISPFEKGERTSHATIFKIEPGGSESNVAIALSNLGCKTKFISRIPNNPLSLKIIQYLKQFNVDTSSILMGGEKLGIYWTENGIDLRPSSVIYDREHSSFTELDIRDINLEVIFKNSSWFHFSGISPAVSENIFNTLLQIINKIQVPYSVDLNYRSKLWRWANEDPLIIKKTIESLCKNATLIAGNESDFYHVFGFKLKNNSENQFDLTAKKCFEKFKHLKFLSISNRDSISASYNNWNGVLYVKAGGINKYIGKTYKIENIEDRVGTGDSFVAGIIYGMLNNDKFTYQEIIDFASTLGALNHTTSGDASRFTADEIWDTLNSDSKGRIIR